MATQITIPANPPVEDKADSQEAHVDGVILEADYAEDRSVARLAEQQRKFQKSLRGHYQDAEMPPA